MLTTCSPGVPPAARIKPMTSSWRYGGSRDPSTCSPSIAFLNEPTYRRTSGCSRASRQPHNRCRSPSGRQRAGRPPGRGCTSAARAPADRAAQPSPGRRRAFDPNRKRGSTPRRLSKRTSETDNLQTGHLHSLLLDRTAGKRGNTQQCARTRRSLPFARRAAKRDRVDNFAVARSGDRPDDATDDRIVANAIVSSATSAGAKGSSATSAGALLLTRGARVVSA